MSLKSRGVFKNFRNVFLLLFIVTVIFIPLEVTRAGIGDLISFNIFDSLVEFVATAMDDEDNKFFGVIFYLAYQLFNICLLAVTILVYFGAWLVDVFLDEAIYARVLDMTNKTSAVYIGWTVIRDACNTFFILFLLLIAFSTILRVQTYNAKSLLPKFIISLFLINFSATIAMLVIDFGQVFMFEIKTWMGAGGFSGSGGSPTSAGSPLTSIVDHFNNNYNYKSPSGTYTLGDVVGVAFAAAYSAILGLLYIMLALFLAVRIVVFVILVIISPFAFFSIILPGMRTYTSQWWQSLVSHAIFGPVFIFFIFLSGQMMRSMQTFKPIKAGDDISSLHYIIAELIPHVVALMMLMAAIPVTQKLGAAGANKFIGGAAGLGKIGIGVVAGAKLLGGGAKKVGGGAVGRAHAGLKGGALGKGVAKGYNKAADKIGGGIKSLPIVGRIKMQNEVAQAQKKKEKIAEKEKLMDNMTDKDKKKYVDSFKLDKNAQAEAQQAMFNLMAKDNGKGLTNKRLMKMGYEKDTGIKRDKLDDSGNVMLDKKGNVIRESVMKFDKEKFEKDYGRSVAHGMDTTNIEKYRPDLIKDKDDRIDKIKKIADDGEEKKIKLDILADEDLAETLKKTLGAKKYKNLINSKTQEERDGLADIKEGQIIKGIQIYKTSGAGAKGAIDNTSAAGKDIILKKQKEIADLAGADQLNEKMKDIIDLKVDQSVDRSATVNIKLAQRVIKDMSKDKVLDLDDSFLEKYGYMLSKSNGGHVAKFGEDTQGDAIKKSLNTEIGKIPVVNRNALNPIWKELEDKLKEINKKI